VKNLLVPIATALACVLALSSCGSETTNSASAPEDLAFAEPSGSSTDLIDAAPDVDLSPEVVDLVQFEADWVCELQRRTFVSQEAIDEALDENLVGLGIERADYDDFRAELSESQDLRESILFAYEENCRP
jgi:hypothetical protein